MQLRKFMAGYRIALASLLVVCTIPQAFGQTGIVDPILFKFDTTLNGFIDRERKLAFGEKQFLSPDAFDVLFKRYFALLAYNRESLGQGNSAALSLSENQTKLNLAIAFSRPSYFFTFGGKVNAADNTGSIFAGSKPASGTELFINQSILFSGSRVLTYGTGNDPATGKSFREMNRLRRRYILDSLQIIRESYKAEFNTLEARRKDTYLVYNKLKVDLDNLNPGDPVVAFYDAFKKANDQLVKAKQDSIRLINLQSEAGELIKKTQSRLIECQLGGDGPLKIRMNWLSYGVSYRKETYNTYDSLRPASERVKELDFNRWSGNASMNFYTERTDYYFKRHKRAIVRSVYVGLTYAISKSNNFAPIRNQTYTETASKTTSGGSVSISSSQQVKNITGKALSEDFVHSIGLQYTGMFKKGIIGFNTIGTSEIQEGVDPTFDVHLGVLFKYLDTNDPKSLANFELFLDLPDLANAQESKKSVMSRSAIGVSATVPFEKVFFK